MARVAEAVERILLIGRTPGSSQDRYTTAGFAILRFAEQARAWHQRFGSLDVEARVRAEMVELERALAGRLGAFEAAPEDRVVQLLERLIESFPGRTH